MRSFLKWSILFLIALWTATVASEEDPNAVSWKTGNLCNNYYCSDRRGHFNQQSFLVGSYIPYRSYKLLLSVTPTTFVIYIRNIKNPSKQTDFMQMCDELKCYYLSSSEDHIFIYKNTKVVTLRIFNPQAQFEVQYYAGCDLFDETDVVIEREAGSLFTQPGYCWIVIPRLYNEATTQHTAATNIFLSTITVPRSSQLSLSNVLTGELVMSLKRSTDLDLASLRRNENVTTYQGNRHISSIFLLNVDKCPPEHCTDIAFKMDIQALSLSDHQCFRNKQICEYGMSKQAHVDCNDVEASVCSSFQHFEAAIVKALEGETSSTQRSLSADNVNKCKWNYRGKEKQYFCAKNKKGNYRKCSTFRKCQLYCFEQRVFAGICKKSNQYF